MNTRIISKILWQRRRLRRRDRWTREQLEAHQTRSLRVLREYAYARSPFYRRFHEGLEGSPLNELPILTKATLMEHFDELVTDPTVRLAGVEDHVASLRGNERFLGRYYVASTSGSTGRRGLFLWDLDEWVSVLASYNRSFDWAGSRAGLTHRTKMAVVSTTTPWHQSARVAPRSRAPGSRRCAWTPETRWRASWIGSTTGSRRRWWRTPRWPTSWPRSSSQAGCGSRRTSSSAPRRS